MKNFDLPANFLSYLDKGNLKITCNDVCTCTVRQGDNHSDVWLYKSEFKKLVKMYQE